MVAKTYDRQTAKFLAVVGENMPEMSGEAMQGWIENPNGLQRFLEGLRSPITFPAWKTLKLGTSLKSADDFRKALKDGKFQISDWANDILGKPAFTTSDIMVFVDLVVLTTAELTGKRNGGTTAEVFAGATRLGLEKCPAEVGPQLRHQYPDQPLGEWLLIGMEPMTDSDGRLIVFGVERGGSGLWLSGSSGSPAPVWDPASQWVFVRPRK